MEMVQHGSSIWWRVSVRTTIDILFRLGLYSTDPVAWETGAMLTQSMSPISKISVITWFRHSGLGLLEYLHWCEDLDMQPIMAVWAGASNKAGLQDSPLIFDQVTRLMELAFLRVSLVLTSKKQLTRSVDLFSWLGIVNVSWQINFVIGDPADSAPGVFRRKHATWNIHWFRW